MKQFSIILIIVAFFGFTIFDVEQRFKPTVESVITPTEFNIDVNSNKTVDEGEHFCLENAETFYIKNSQEQIKKAKALGITPADAVALGYLAKNFTTEKLLEQSVRIRLSKNQSPYCSNIEMFYKGRNFKDILAENGFATKNGKIVNYKKFEKNLKYEKSLKLQILNYKSNKYHELDCKFGQMAHNIIILPFKMLPKDAKPCKYCHSAVLQAQKVKKAPVLWADTYFSKGFITVYLTDLTTTTKPSMNCSTKLCKELVREINNTHSTLDIALYGYSDVPAIKNSLIAAKSRGVKVRLVYDLDKKGNNFYPDTYLLKNIIKDTQSDVMKISSKKLNPLMHNKFFIFDNSRVLTGSSNISPNDMSGFNSNSSILIKSPEIARIYKSEFEQMYNGSFHQDKISNGQRSFSSGKTKISVYFSPQDTPIKNTIIPLINNAQKYIYVPTFLITHKNIAAALIQAKKRGVDVKVIIDATNARSRVSKHEELRRNNVPVKTENYAGKMHSKSMIIDDKYVIIGSMNFSNSGEYKNDENTLVIENRELALFYRAFFDYLWQKIPNIWLKYNAQGEGKSAIGSCSDGIDNDFDGKIDMQDEGCKGK